MIRRDLQHHAVYSFALAVAGAFLLGSVGLGAIATLAIGAGKEMWWDKRLGRGHPDWLDMAANVVGVIGAVIIMRRWGA